MGNVSVDFMPPKYWQDFERLTLDWARKVWSDPYAERHGREGQAQGGVDVFGINKKLNEYTGVQCKKRTWITKPGADAPSDTLTTKEIDAEISAARNFQPPLDRFIIATTGRRDADLQAHVRKLNVANIAAGTKPEIALMFWDDYEEHLNNDTDLMYRYFADVLRYRQSYSPDEHYYRLLHMAFDRPAIRTHLQSENRAADLITALAHTQEAISTGILKDRHGHIIDQAPKPKSIPKELQHAKKKLQEARDLATLGLSSGAIQEQGSWICIQDPTLTARINALRSESVESLNKAMLANGMQTLPPVHFS